jgi:3-hydroxyisobutyrate dehydrogenase-like beta-hydroxyacid dehydrogenase
MGNPMVRALLTAGYSVAVHEPLPENRASAVAAGASVADSVAHLARGCDVVMTTLADDAILHDVVFGPDGLAQCLGASQVFVEMSTVSPRVSAEIAAALAGRSVDYIRAPISGSTATATTGQLTIMASGPEPGWQRVDPILACFAAKRFWVGRDDEARYLKLAVSVLVGSLSALLGEALAIGRCGGLSVETLLDVICESAAGSPLLRYKRDAILAGDYDPSFSVDQMLKDFELIGEVADRGGITVELVAAVRRRYEAAQRAGLSDRDYFVLAKERVADQASASDTSGSPRAIKASTPA